MYIVFLLVCPIQPASLFQVWWRVHRGSWRVQNSMGKTGAGVLEINSMFTLKDTANVMEDLRYAAKFCSEIHRTRSFSGWRTYNCWCSDAFSLILKDRHDMHAWKKSRLVVFPAKRTISSNLRGGWTSLSFHQVERWYLLGWGTQRLEVGSVSDVRRGINVDISRFRSLTKITLQGTNISSLKGILKMMFLFPRWDMLVPWRVSR